MEGFRGNPWSRADVTRLTIILLMTDQAQVAVPRSDLPVAPGPEEVSVVARHFLGVTARAGVFVMAHHALLFVELPDFAVRMPPFVLIVRLRLRVVMAGVALTLRVTVHA